jgi:hypothetical protein
VVRIQDKKIVERSKDMRDRDPLEFFTQDPWRGLPKVNPPSRQWLSKVEIAFQRRF